MKNTTTFLFVLFNFISLLAQDTEQRLTLKQILDSAKQKHPSIARKALEVKASEKNQKSYLDFQPLEISYSQGNLYNASTDKVLEFKQNFGSPLSFATQKELLKTDLAFRSAEQQLLEKQIFAEIKKAYFQCQYYIELGKLFQQEFELYLRAYNLFLIDDTLKSPNIERLMISTALAESEMNNRTAYNHLISAQNQLLHASFLEVETLPVDTVFEIYEITASTDKSSRTPAHLYNNLWDLRHKQTAQQYKISKSKFAPSFFAGYSINTINGQSGFNYWSIGIAIPILAFSQASELQKSKINLQISRLELIEKRSENDAITANMLTKMNLYFERINYHYDVALQQSFELLSIADDQLKTNPYPLEKFLWSVNKAFSIRKDYLQNILQYNLIAADLELYAY